MTETKEKIVLFESIRQVMKAEHYCQKTQLKHRVMPVPRHISSECGMCLVTDTTTLLSLINYLDQQNTPYRVEDKGKEEK